MKSTIMALALLAMPQFTLAHDAHPLVGSHAKSVLDSYESALHKAGYAEADFDSLVGVSSVQDTAKKVRILRFTFAEAQCAKNLEVYLKLDGSKYLAHKVIGCM